MGSCIHKDIDEMLEARVSLVRQLHVFSARVQAAQARSMHRLVLRVTLALQLAMGAI